MRLSAAGMVAAWAATIALGGPSTATASSSPVPHFVPAPSATPQHLTPSQIAIRDCAQNSDFLDVAGQGAVCQGGPAWVMRMGDGHKVTVSAPDLSRNLLAGVALHPAAAASLSSQQCVNPVSHPHVELYYAHFSGQTDNYASHVADIQQMFRDVDASYINYDASTYFGVGEHLYVECDANFDPVVHDIALSTPIGNSNFDTIITNMSNQGHNSNLAHYWIWTDGNPEAAFGYAGQSTIQDDDSASASNQINQTFQYSVNYGFSDAGGGGQIFAHENGHAMGAVQLSAPHSTGLWHCTDGYDVMCYDDGGTKSKYYSSGVCHTAPNGTVLFDCNFNDYFNPAPAAGSYLATHWNTASPNNHWLYLVPAATTSSLSASLGTTMYSQPATFTATVHPPSGAHPGTPAGSVGFYDGSALLGSATLNSAGVAAFTTASLGVGGHAITASFNGSTLYGASTSSAASLTVNQASSTTTLSSSADPAPLGGTLSITATVAPVAPAAGAPAGSVTFYDSGAAIGTASLSGGHATLSTQSLTYGPHQLTAVYGGSSGFAGSDDTATPYSQSILYATVASISSSAANDTAEYGTQLTFSSTVITGPGTPSGPPAPTGTVTFKDGSTSLATVTLSGHAAGLTTSALSPGVHHISAVYSGDTNYAPNASTLTESVTTWHGLYELDGYGGMHPVASPQLPDRAGGWPWPIARGIVLRSDAKSGYVLDGFGGLHPFGGAPNVTISGYWRGWDIARGVVLRPDGVSGYVLDGFGSLHPFGGAPAVQISGYWRGWDIAHAVVLRSDGTSGYVLDGFGGLHPFGVAGDMAPRLPVSGYWSGWDIARSVALDPDGKGGYVLDGFGGVHPVGNAPSVRISGYWHWDIARRIVVMPGPLHMGYVLDGWGALHPFGGAPADSPPHTAWFPGKDVARGLAIT